MVLQLKELILWPRISSLGPRRLYFQPGKLNIITGASRTGKSAIIPIIDYCLGSKTCSIPILTIREECSWFGILVQTSQGDKLFARREPGNQRETGDMFVLQGDSISIPDKIETPNDTAERVRLLLDEMSGLTSLNFIEGENSSSSTSRPSFRDLSAFIFQPQNIIANPDVLFYKADTYEHREKLRGIFPYLLNAITPEILAKQHELARLEKDLRRKERELRAVQTVSVQWIGSVKSKIVEARELGLIEEVEQNLSLNAMLDILRRLVSRNDQQIKVSEITISASIEEIEKLNKQDSNISQELTSLRKRLQEMRLVRNSATDYRDALIIQRDRLKITDWLLMRGDNFNICPVCSNSIENNSEKLMTLQHNLRALENSTSESEVIPVVFDREYEQTKSIVQSKAEELAAIQARQRTLESRSKSAANYQFQAKKAERFIGGLEEAIKTFEKVGVDSDLANEINLLRSEILVIKESVDPNAIKERIKSALDSISAYSARWLPDLDVEEPISNIHLDIQNLTIKVNYAGRQSFLWELGSGSNWLSCHLAIMIGLHKFFRTSKHNPVPGLLIVDQPSQVYFPKVLIRRAKELEAIDPSFRDEDIQAVRKTFSFLNNAVNDAKGRLQVLVLDHAHDDTWGELSEVYLVEEWRDGNKLVPMAWLTDVDSDIEVIEPVD